MLNNVICTQEEVAMKPPRSINLYTTKSACFHSRRCNWGRGPEGPAEGLDLSPGFRMAWPGPQGWSTSCSALTGAAAGHGGPHGSAAGWWQCSRAPQPAHLAGRPGPIANPSSHFPIKRAPGMKDGATSLGILLCRYRITT